MKVKTLGLLLAGFVLAGTVGTAEAASVKWTINKVLEQGTTTTVKASNTSYMLFLLCAEEAPGYTIAANSFSAGSDTVVYSGNMAGAGGTGSTGKSYETPASGTYYYVALFNSKGAASATAFDYYQVSSTITGNAIAVAPQTPVSLTWTTTAATWTAVPEPCSVALVLLGVAALGLKRKIA